MLTEFLSDIGALLVFVTSAYALVKHIRSRLASRRRFELGQRERSWVEAGRQV